MLGIVFYPFEHTIHTEFLAAIKAPPSSIPFCLIQVLLPSPCLLLW